MIKKIKLNNTPPYLCEEQVIEAKHINFLFGRNGSGKTTISRYLRSQERPCYSDCSIEWGSTSIKCAVYNKDYVEENFRTSSIPGIFTLGEENIKVQEQIEEYTKSINKLNQLLSELQQKLKGVNEQLQTHEASYADKFWEKKQQFDQEESPLRLALEGVRGSKDIFKNRLLDEHFNNTSEIAEKTELEELCRQLYDGTGEKCPNLSIPVFDPLYSIETAEILKKIVVGKSDVDISRLIKKLGSDNWFRQGTKYIDKSEGLCPFCQRPLESVFLDKISEYFDEAYFENVEEIDKIYEEYDRISHEVLSEVRAIIDNPSSFIKIGDLSAAYQQLKSTIDENIRQLLNKKNEPNIIVQLKSTRELAGSILQILDAANKDIATYNKRIEDIKAERKILSSKVWKYIINDLNTEILDYLDEKDELKKSITSTKASIDSTEKDIADKSDSQHSLEQKLTSIVPTANGINELLRKYDITGFHISVDKSKKTYQLVREDGSPADESLSEGERNFVTFLYFMYSLQGNTDESGHNDEKVVVIDDPVSSLDNDVLFLVSSLIRDQFKKIYKEESTIKQLFVLSHNIFFFKEVSYEQGINKKKTGYWMISKNNDHSLIKECEKNPVSSTYEMLWDEIRNAQANSSERNTISLANTMRRVLEHYFKLLGEIDLNTFHLEFPDGERQIFKSLISWTNAGSHSAFDDYSATPNQDDSAKYLKVFRDLFDKVGHIAHYNMMMKLTKEKNEHGQTEI